MSAFGFPPQLREGTVEGANNKFPILQIPVVFSLPAAVDFSGSSTNCCLHSSNSGGIQWERQGRECLFHLVQSQNPSPRVAVDCQKRRNLPKAKFWSEWRICHNGPWWRSAEGRNVWSLEGAWGGGQEQWGTRAAESWRVCRAWEPQTGGRSPFGSCITWSLRWRTVQCLCSPEWLGDE